MNEIVYIVFSLIIFLKLTNGQFFGTDSVRFDVEEIEDCDENSLWKWKLDIKTLNNTHVSLTFNVTLESNFDDTLTLILEFYQWTSKKQWKRVIRIVKKKPCSFIKTIAGEQLMKMGEEVGITSRNCPIAKGNYHLENRIIDVQSTIFGKFLVGRFKGMAKSLSSKKEILFWGKGSFTTAKI